MLNKKVRKNPVCAIYWQDAAFAYTKEMPPTNQPTQLTIGFIISTNRSFTNIATNVNYNLKTGELWPVDGFVIPNKAIIKFKKLRNLNGK